jgi:hypothetical protein
MRPEWELKHPFNPAFVQELKKVDELSKEIYK